MMCMITEIPSSQRVSNGNPDRPGMKGYRPKVLAAFEALGWIALWRYEDKSPYPTPIVLALHHPRRGETPPTNSVPFSGAAAPTAESRTTRAATVKEPR